MCSPEQSCSGILRTAGGVDINLRNITGEPEVNRPDKLGVVLVERDVQFASDWPAGVGCIAIYPMLAVLLKAIVRQRFALRMLINIAANLL